ncbi:MAG: glycosyltransferase family 4 protein [Candidatus Aenigmarchaeota archaeon]|nr:glycosyltransferase family 4 protein [Candidatus Aenigmarchaeota archaeon]
MKIVMVCPQISSSSFITTYPYAKILSKEHDVKIVGPLLGKEPFIRDATLDFEFIEPPVGRPPQLALASAYFSVKKRLMRGDFDVMHAFKLFPNTAMPAAAVKRRIGKKLVITVDDYDVASPKNPFKRLVLRAAERAYKSADRMIVSSTYLQKIYGGDIIHQVANEPLFLGKKYTGAAVRKKYDLQDKKIILYAGTIFEHKGIDVLIKAVQSLNDKDVKLVVVGEGKTALLRLAGDETLYIGKAPIEEIPDFVAACDVYAIPTRPSTYANAQIPGKIFEPMMMGRAVIASAVSDIPAILDYGKAGLVVRPNDVRSLADGLKLLLSDDSLRRRLGDSAKRRYEAMYSYARIEEKIKTVYSKL